MTPEQEEAVQEFVAGMAEVFSNAVGQPVQIIAVKEG